MIAYRFIRLTLIAAVAAAQTIAGAAAQSPTQTIGLRVPKLLNPGVLFADKTPKSDVFFVSWGTERFPKGINLNGTYRVESGVISVCITRAFLPDRAPQTAAPGQCLAHATPMPDAEIEKLPDGSLKVFQAQPFYLLD